MAMGRVKISQELRLQIIVQSMEPGCDIAELAREHGVSRKSIYLWRSKYKKSITTPIILAGAEETEIFTAKPKSNKSAEFVELALSDQAPVQGQNLSRAELVFTDFSLQIEGKIKSNALLQMVKILEESC